MLDRAQQGSAFSPAGAATHDRRRRSRRQSASTLCQRSTACPDRLAGPLIHRCRFGQGLSPCCRTSFMISLLGTVTIILLYYGAVIEEGAVPHKLVMTRQVRDWLHALRSGDPVTRRLVAEAIDQLLDEGPRLGRPLADRISGSRLHNLKELRPGSSGASEVRNLVYLRPGAQRRAAGRGRQIRPLAGVVSQGDPGG
jgi:hypothetical protein